MAVFKCKMCGGSLNINSNETVVTCEYCGTQQTLPKFDDERKITLFTRANHLRFNCEFDKAAGVYESIVAEFPDEAEAYWGLLLCKYGIEYVDDNNGKKIPTCHRTLPTSIMDDEDFSLACDYADTISKGIYREEAKAIDGIQKKILKIAATEEPYDIFICYKETDDNTGARTEDSSIAQDIYTELIKDGYKVFFSRVTLREVAGTEYEPYIYAALSSAKVMLAIGTKFEYYDAVWVKNEWSRFISMIGEDSSKVLIPCYRNMDAYDMPKEFKNMQALDMGDVTFFASLTANINRLLPKEKASIKETVVVNNSAGSDIAPLLKRAFMFIEDGDWNSADEYCERVLDIYPECAEAYLGKLMTELKVKKLEQLKNCKKPFDNLLSYNKVQKFGDDELRNTLVSYINYIKERKEKAFLEHERQKEIAHKKLVQKREQCYKTSTLISASGGHTVGVKLDGKVFVTNYLGLGVYSPKSDALNWTDIIAISSSDYHTVGLKFDGTVVATGKNKNGQCKVSTWKNIVAISAGTYHTVGLKSDGTVVVIGNNSFQQCDVSDWSDIIAVAAGVYHTVGLKSDGTVVAAGANDSGQCNVSNWTDIVAISAGYQYTVGLKSNGTVIATGRNYEGQCQVSNWQDIVAIYTGGAHTVGLKSDGTVVAVGPNHYGQCKVSTWKNIVAISAGTYHTVGLKSDGTVVSTGENKHGQCDVFDWKLFNDINNLEEEQQIIREQRIAEEKRKAEKERRIAEQQAQYRSQGLCQHCGGELKGFIGKKCVACGKSKDY